MAKRMWFLAVLLALVISLGVTTLKGFGKDEQLEKKEANLSIVSGKIDEILKNQQDIIARLQDIRDQQDIIRVRASR